MSKIVHDAFVELFRSDGQLIKEVVSEGFGLKQLRPEVLSPELTQIPAEYRADALTVFKNRAGEKCLAVIVEVQNTDDENKPYTWPSYLCAARARHRCPTILLVVTTDEKIARKARASIDLGHPGFQLTPIVITPDTVPIINDLDSARRLPQLAVFSALNHSSIETATAALSVLDKVSLDYIEVYRDLIMSKFSKQEQIMLEANPEHYEWKSEQAKKQLAEIRAASKSEGRIQAQQENVVRLARAQLELSPEREAQIRQLADEDQLFALILELARATSAERVHAVLSGL